MASASASLESATRGAKSSAALEFLKSSPKKLLINGKWVPSKSGKTFETLNPSNEQVLALVAEGDKADVDEAVKHARKAYEEGKWASMSPHQRTHFLLKIAELIDKHAEELAELETLDNGKPLFESKNIDIPGAAETFRYYAGFATKIYGETNPSDPSMFNYTLREPVGVCGQIIPWNFPLLMASWKIAPALACGNVVILKPAEQTPLTAHSPRRAYLRSGTARGRRANRHGLRPRRRQLDRRASRYRQGRVHRIERSRQDNPESLGRQPEARVARARRQVAQHHLPRRRHAVGGVRLRDGHLHEPGSGLLRRLARVRAGERVRSVHR